MIPVIQSKLYAMTEKEKNTLLNGKEDYPVIGNLPDEIHFPIPVQSISNILVQTIAGASVQWECIQKADTIFPRVLSIFHPFASQIELVIGSLYVDSAEPGVSYGYSFRPAAGEFHAWIEITTKKEQLFIVDVSLPGTIITGLASRDEKGPFLIGRVPSVLIGFPPTWLRYKKETLLKQTLIF
jgi:hypothetical protein